MADESPIEQPDDPFGLWQAIGPQGHWPRGNEIQMRRLGEGWNNAGIEFQGAGGTLTSADTNVDRAWPDPAGTEYGARTTELGNITFATGQEMKRLGVLATEYGKDIAYAKNAIIQMIDKNGRLYDSLRNWLGFPDAEQRQQLASRLATEITTFLDQMAARIRARDTGAPTGGQPVLRPVSPNDGFTHTEGAAIHLSGSVFGTGLTGSVGVANVNGKPTVLFTGGSFATTDPLPSASVTGGTIESNATEPDQVKDKFDFAGGSITAGPGGPTPGGELTGAPLLADDESFGPDHEGDLITVHEPQLGVGLGLGPGLVNEPELAHIDAGDGPLATELPEDNPITSGLPGEVHAGSTWTKIWTPFN